VPPPPPTVPKTTALNSAAPKTTAPQLATEHLSPSVKTAIGYWRQKSSYSLETHRDSLLGATVQELAFNRLAGPTDTDSQEMLDDGTILVWSLEQVHLKARHLRRDDGAAHYELEVLYRGEKELGIPPGKTLTLHFAHGVIELDGDGGQQQLLAASHQERVEERAFYTISQGQLQDLAVQERAWVVISGRDKTIERECSSHNLGLLQQFADETSTLRATVTRTSDLGGPSLMVYLDMGRVHGLNLGDRGQSLDGIEVEIRSLQPQWSIGAVPRQTPLQKGAAVLFGPRP
jgi:hypothetical protein